MHELPTIELVRGVKIKDLMQEHDEIAYSLHITPISTAFPRTLTGVRNWKHFGVWLWGLKLQNC